MTTTEPMTVAVIGATGFVGNAIVQELAREGHRVRAVSRDGRREGGWADTVEPMRGDVTSGEGIDSALAGADGVVHLVAIPKETGGRTFDEVNVRGTARVVATAEQAGVKRFVHMSALGVTDDPRLKFLHSKWRGEEAARGSTLDWVVLRPSLLFGPGDGFFTLVRTTLKWWSPGVVAIPGDGSARFQPLAVDDLAVAVRLSLTEPQHVRQVYELGGPDWLTYREIVDRVSKVTGMRRLKLPMPIPLLNTLTVVTDRVLPIFPVSHDQIQSMKRPNFTDRDAYVKAFGREPRPMDLGYLAD